jgi:putative pyruvate formate lyase activating enzyme
MKFLADDISRDTYVNIMEQYRPTFKVGQGETRARQGFTKYEDIDRPVSSDEVDEVKQFAIECGLWRFEDNVWIQNPSSLR